MQSAVPHTTKPASRVVSFQSKEHKSKARNLDLPSPKTTTAAKAAFADEEQIPPLSPNISARVMQALREDADPLESLADIRGLLIGPTARVHEARIEELLSIMEEADRSYQRAFRDIHARGDEMIATSDVIMLEVVKTNEAIVNASTQQDLNLLQATREMGHGLKELSQKFESNFQKLFGDLTHRIDTLATKTADDHQSLMNNITKRIDDLESATFANDEHILSKFENQVAATEASLKMHRMNDLNSIADGLSELSDRVTKLRTA